MYLKPTQSFVVVLVFVLMLANDVLQITVSTWLERIFPGTLPTMRPFYEYIISKLILIFVNQQIINYLKYKTMHTTVFSVQ